MRELLDIMTDKEQMQAQGLILNTVYRKQSKARKVRAVEEMKVELDIGDEHE